jgi:DNA-binding NarL/FixJ family response regulator
MQDIYLVEDSEAVRERLATMLGSIPDTRVIGQAGDVREAIAGILATRPHVVVLDLKLAHGNGFEVLSEVLRREPAIDIYMLSSFSSEPYRRHALRLGAKDFFDKTSEIARLRDTVAARALVTQPN